MIDVQDITSDVNLLDTVIYQAENLLKTQAGFLAFAQDFGIDLDFFLMPNIEIAIEVFENYIQQELGARGIGIRDVQKVINTFRDKLNITLNNNTDVSNTSLIGG